MTSAPARLIKVQPLNEEAYAPYGQVIAALDGKPFKPANFGLAKRFNYLADVLNLRPGTAKFNLCIFRCTPFDKSEMSIKMLEKHPYSTQVFMPMQDGKYITIVARGDDKPDLSTLKAFIVEGPQAVTYLPGIWHYPMTALGKQLDMACLIFEDETASDCTIAELTEPITVHL